MKEKEQGLSRGEKKHVRKLKSIGKIEEAHDFREKILKEKRKKKKNVVETGEERALKRLGELNKRLEKLEVQEPLDLKEWVETKWRKMWVGMFIRIKYSGEDVDTYSETGKIFNEIKLKCPDVYEWASQLIDNGKVKTTRFGKWRDEEESFIKGIIRPLS